MKNLRLLIGIVITLGIVCSPALAISIADFREDPSNRALAKKVVDFRGDPSDTPYASVLISSTPKGMVFLDGSFQGLTPIEFVGLSVGTHQLRVSWPGYETYSTEIVIPEYSCNPSGGRLEYITCMISAGGVRPINVTLKKVESTPTIVPTPTPTPLDSDDDDGAPVKVFDKSRFKTKLPEIAIPQVDPSRRLPKPINRG